MDSHFVSCRYASSADGSFTFKIYPQKMDEVVLEYQNDFSGKPEIVNDKKVLRLLYSGIEKLEGHTENQADFERHLSLLPPDEQAVVHTFKQTVRLENDTCYPVVNELLYGFREAEEAGFFQGLETITKVKNLDEWSSWEVKDATPFLEDGFYCLSGSMTKPYYVYFSFLKLPFSRKKLLENLSHGEPDTIKKQLQKACSNSWDNVLFLYGNLYRILQQAYSYKNQITETPEGKSELPDAFWQALPLSKRDVARAILDNISADDWPHVYELISEAQKMGFWQLYWNRNVAQTLEKLTQIHDFYKNATPEFFADNQTSTATEAEIAVLEEELGEALPGDYKAFLLHNTLSFDFDGNFKVLSLKEAVNCWQRMNKLLEEGVFDDVRVQHHIENGFGNWDGIYIQKVWWSKKWFPFAEDSCGNMKCIDFDPDENGRSYQLVSMEHQDGQGPFLLSEYEDFADYVAKHLRYLQKGQYRITDKMIEVDSYLKPAQ